MDDATLLAAFEARTLPFTEWRHATHIRVAHYSKARITHPEAKASFVAPDLAPLPR